MKEFLRTNHITHALKCQQVTNGVVGITSSYVSILGYDRIIIVGISGDLSAAGQTMSVCLWEATALDGTNSTGVATATFTATASVLSGSAAVEKRCEEFTNSYNWAAIHVACSENDKYLGGIIIRSESRNYPIVQDIVTA